MASLKELQDDKYVLDFVKICSEIDPSKTNKYVPYMLKLIETYIQDIRTEYATTTFKEIRELVTDFHDLSERNQIDNKDIYSYESFGEVSEIVKLGKSKITESQVKKDETFVLFEDDQYIVVRPKSIKSSRLYGANTKWCTASDRADYEQHFHSYAGEGVLVYFINKKGKPKEDKWAKLAFHMELKEGGNFTIWDVEDKQLSASDMFSAIRIIPQEIYDIIDTEIKGGNKIKLIK